MASSLFQQENKGNSILAALGTIKQMANGNPQALFDHMYQTDNSFRQFADSVKGKTPEEAFRENGLDYEQVRNLMR